MNDVKLGCQTITWGESQREHFPQVFAEVAAAGFTGVEIGFRHIQDTPPNELKRMLGDQGLTLLASHIGGNLEDTGQAAGERNMLDQVLDYLQQTGTPRLMYSGLKYQDDAQFQRDLDMLTRSAQRCRRQGVDLLYHNHNWEFADDGRVIEALIGRTEVGFCPDIGWVMKGQADVLTLLNRITSRIGAIHFKDFASRDPAVEHAALGTVMLGQGVAPLAETARWAREHVPDVWMIAEQDQSDRTPEQAAGHNGEYLRRIFSENAA